MPERMTSALEDAMFRRWAVLMPEALMLMEGAEPEAVMSLIPERVTLSEDALRAVAARELVPEMSAVKSPQDRPSISTALAPEIVTPRPAPEAKPFWTLASDAPERARPSSAGMWTTALSVTLL